MVPLKLERRHLVVVTSNKQKHMALDSPSSPQTIPLSSVHDPLDEPLRPWHLPKIRANDVFKPHNRLFRWLDLPIVSNVKFVQGRSEITVNSEKTVTMPLIPDSWEQISYEDKGFRFVQLGMIQFGIAPRTGRALNTSALACVLDSRHLNFQDALLTAMESTLEEGPIYFTYRPNYSLSIHDPGLNEALKVRIRTCGALAGHAYPEQREDEGRVKHAISWRVCYRLSKRAVFGNPTPFGVYFQSSLDGKQKTLKKVDPEQVQLPKKWLQEQRTLIRDESSSDPTRLQAYITEDGNVRISYGPPKEEEEPNAPN